MRIGPDEIEIAGTWLMVSGRLAEDDVCRRIDSLIKSELQHVATTKDGWEKLYRDPHDGRFWELTYPHGAMQGGGPPALIFTSPAKASEKYNVSVG